MSTIDEDEVWAFMDEVGTLFQEAIGRDLNDFDGDEGWQECHLKFFREMADELKRHGVRWDSDVGYISKLDEMRLVAANRDALRLERDTLQTSLHAAREELQRLKKIKVPWEVIGSLNFLEEYAIVRPKKFKQKIQKIRKFIDSLESPK